MELKESAKDTVKETAKAVLKVNRKTFINPRAWLGYDALKDQTTTLISLIKSLFASPRSRRKESYDEAMQRLKLTDEEVQQTGVNYHRFAILYLFLFLLILVASFSLLIIEKSFLGLLLGLAVSVFLLAQAFQNHFWYFQIKNRKLGCTFEEWRNGKLN